MSICTVAERFIEPEPRVPRILIIEDDIAITVLLQRAFSPWVLEVRTAEDYASVDVETDEPDGYDLVVLDLRIPGCNMSDLLRLVSKKTHCPVMVYSGNIDDNAIHTTISLLDRPVWFIQKPAQFTRDRICSIFRMTNMELRPRHAVAGGSALKPDC